MAVPNQLRVVLVLFHWHVDHISRTSLTLYAPEPGQMGLVYGLVGCTAPLQLTK